VIGRNQGAIQSDQAFLGYFWPTADVRLRLTGETGDIISLLRETSLI